MAAPCGISLVTHSVLLKFPSITFFDASGISHVIAILDSAPHSLFPSIFSVVQSWSSTLLSRALSSPSYVVKTIFHDSSVLAFTQTGFNAMFDHQFAKPYRHQHVICGEVIRHLRL